MHRSDANATNADGRRIIIMTKRVIFIEMMGVPGSYDASVYDHFDDKDDEGAWF